MTDPIILKPGEGRAIPLGSFADRGAADEELAGIAERHGMEITGPIPEHYL